MTWLASVAVSLSEWLLEKLFALVARDYQEYKKEKADKESAKAAIKAYDEAKGKAQTKQESKDAGKDLLNS